MRRNQSLSVLMPVKNAENYISASIGYIEANLGPLDEVLVIDDKSEDSTLALATAWALRNHKVKVFSNPGAGLVDALNFGVTKSINEWIARFDVDDHYSNDRLKIQSELIEDDISAIFSDYTFVGSSGEYLGFIGSAITPNAMRISLFSGARTPHPSVIFNKYIFEKSGGYLSNEFPAEDLGLWLRMANFGLLVSVPQPLLKYQLHSSSVTSINRGIAKQRKIELLRKHPIELKVVHGLWDEIETIFVEYRKHPNSNLRIILLIRDILSCIKMHQKGSLQLLVIALRLFCGLSKNWPLELGKFLRDWIIRSVYRRKTNFFISELIRKSLKKI